MANMSAFRACQRCRSKPYEVRIVRDGKPDRYLCYRCEAREKDEELRRIEEARR